MSKGITETRMREAGQRRVGWGRARQEKIYTGLGWTRIRTAGRVWEGGEEHEWGNEKERLRNGNRRGEESVRGKIKRNKRYMEEKYKEKGGKYGGGGGGGKWIGRKK